MSGKNPGYFLLPEISEKGVKISIFFSDTLTTGSTAIISLVGQKPRSLPTNFTEGGTILINTQYTWCEPV